ncbi:XRE family transcriptional regulator [Streptomyces sp. WAC 06783]|uniref:helix-turn-helix domain-containing protein n=1 Tax=Streptomyces sp. WAC 06783 TaxID=2203211 RepID=UPI000F744E69|nr:helix-turn-helix domain-containing protein [Streptomyces sp. WAC 06783]RSO10823.1 XRE family transcriptional regulator [Streptomyces sp. WAC 06783]
MDIRGNTDPAAARDVTEFLAMLRDLKERRGLTYRQLEQRAAEQGEVLARSTLADVLGGRRLPRPEVLAVFVRACGEGERLTAWLEARENVAARGRNAVGPAGESATATTEVAAGEQATAPRRIGRRTPLLLAMAAALAAVGITAWMLVSKGSPADSASGVSGKHEATTGATTPDQRQSGRGGDAATGAKAGAQRAAPVGWIRVRPALAPALCVTEGPAQEGRYDGVVAVQRPCGDVAPQRTKLEPAGAHTYRIAWVHPDPARGKGCLKALSGGPADGLLEPRNACGEASSFRVEREPSGTGGEHGRYVFRADGQRCLGVRDSRTAVGAEVMLQRCTGGAAQKFLIDTASQ